MIPNNLDNLTKKELINFCISNNISECKPNYNKKKIIELIKKHNKTNCESINESGNKPNNTDLIISSKLQTKDWRKSRTWYKNGKSNECENYQKNLIKQLLDYNLTNTNERFNIETNEIISNTNPNKNINYFEITEDFDGKIESNENTIYFNLKFCCDEGGAQTRTLREVYHFIKCQTEYVKKCIGEDCKIIIPYFINILDGDTCYKFIDKIKYSLEKYKIDKSIYNEITKYIFIGDMEEFSKNTDLVNLIKSNNTKKI